MSIEAILVLWLALMGYMFWRNSYVYKLRMDWLKKVGLAEHARISQGKWSFTSFDISYSAIYSYDKMVLHFWLFGIDAMIEDRDQYNKVLTLWREANKT